MADLIGAGWNIFKGLINTDAFDTFFQDTVIWKRSLGGINRFQEDNDGMSFTNITLKTLIQYNHFKVWPVTQGTASGESDKQNTVLLFNLKQLNDLGYINAHGNFDYKEDEDRFILDGISYKASGDTKISQAKDEPLLLQIILTKEEITTGSELT